MFSLSTFCAPPAGLGTSSLKKRSWLARLSLGTVVLIFLVVPLHWGLGASSDEPAAKPAPESDSGQGRQSAAPSSSKAAKPSEADEDADIDYSITTLIPDMKMLINSPDTVIDLDEEFAGQEIAKGNETLTYEVLYSKKDVAEAIIDGNRLRLKWGQRTGKSREVRIRATNSVGESIDTKFQVEIWKPDYLKLVMTVIGGLGIFLLGMKNMSEGLQAVAGGGLRRLISAVTENRLMAVGVGTLVTMTVQSSSITTVMVVGFVNSGFMTLSQAVGVIMGANVGTTFTGWIIALKIGKFGLPILGVAAFAYLFSKRDRLRYTAMAIMGLGMVFLGLELMKDGFTLVKNLPEFEAWFATFNAENHFGVFKCIMVGCILTFIVQSSSATLGITMALAAIGVIPFQTAAALVLGENIGTTITAWLASFGTTTNARRAAYFHVLFNILGVLWITALFFYYIPFVEFLVESIWGLDKDTGQIDTTTGIAATHTCFNVANTIFFFPFASMLARFLQRVIPEKPHKEKPHLTSLDIRMLETPVIGMEQSRIEVLRMGEGCNKMMIWLKEILESDVPDDRIAQKTFHREEVLDTIQDEITAFMSNMLVGNVPHTVIDEARRQLRMADEFESISDYIIVTLKSHLKLVQSGLKIPDLFMKSLLQLHDDVADYLQMIYQGYEYRQREVITKANSRGEAITHRIKDLRDDFLVHMTQDRIDPQVSVAYNAQLNAYRRVRDHALNVAEAIAGEK